MYGLVANVMVSAKFVISVPECLESILEALLSLHRKLSQKNFRAEKVKIKGKCIYIARFL